MDCTENSSIVAQGYKVSEYVGEAGGSAVLMEISALKSPNSAAGEGGPTHTSQKQKEAKS